MYYLWKHRRCIISAQRWHQTGSQALINYTTQSPSVTSFASLCSSLDSYQSGPPVPSSLLVLFIQNHLFPCLLSFNTSSSLSLAVTSDSHSHFLIISLSVLWWFSRSYAWHRKISLCCWQGRKHRQIRRHEKKRRSIFIMTNVFEYAVNMWGVF